MTVNCQSRELAILGVNFSCGKSTREEILSQILSRGSCKTHPTHTLLKLKLISKK